MCPPKTLIPLIYSASLLLLTALFSPVSAQVTACDQLDSIVIEPAGPISITAGDSMQFRAIGFVGSLQVDSIDVDWEVLDCTDCIGVFGGSMFYARRTGTGRIGATCGAVSSESGAITVLPGDLSRMTVLIATSQVVGAPLRGTPAIVLYDAFNNLKYDYSLAAEPIDLISSSSPFEPSRLADDQWQSGGVVRLDHALVGFPGPSGQVALTATNGAVTSLPGEAFYNGYDVIELYDEIGQPLERLVAGVSTTIDIELVNHGNLVATGPVTVTICFDDSDTSTVTFVPSPVGTTDRVTVTLGNLGAVPAMKTLTVHTEATFRIGGLDFVGRTEFERDIDVRPATVLSLAEPRLTPDSLLSDRPTPFQFTVNIDGLVTEIDQIDLQVYLLGASGPDTLGLIFSDEIVPLLTTATAIDHEVVLIVPEGVVPATGWYRLGLDYELSFDGERYTLAPPNNDSVYVIRDYRLRYVAGSLAPDTVFANSSQPYFFIDIALPASPRLTFYPEHSQFSVRGTGFMTTTTLQMVSDGSQSGTARFQSEGIFIPNGQRGKKLGASTVVAYTIRGISDTLRDTVSMVQDSIFVVDRPVIRIDTLRVVAPNAPRVNTGQVVELQLQLSNLLSTNADSLEVALDSDGMSRFRNGYDSITIVLAVPADTSIVVTEYFTASSTPRANELLIASITSLDVEESPPIDFSELITIERPADLSLSYELINVENDFVDYGTVFELVAELTNMGDAETTPGSFRLTAGGFQSGLFDTSGIIEQDQDIEFRFTAPALDTTLEFSFELTGFPIDANSGLPALLRDSSFSFSIKVVSVEGSLLVNARSLGANLVVPDVERDLLAIDLTNTGFSDVSTLQVERLDVVVTDKSGEAVDAREILTIGSTLLLEDGRQVALTTAGGNRLRFDLDEFLVGPQDTRSLVLRTRFKQTYRNSVSLSIPRDGFVARFIDGPNAGQLINVTGPDESDEIYTSPVAIVEASFDGSFVVETNPFNPDLGPVHFSYQLQSAADVEFTVLTLIGEEVVVNRLRAGSPGGQAGLNEIVWDGRNGAGHEVLNGVYIVQLRNIETGEKARLKLAVLK